MTYKIKLEIYLTKGNEPEINYKLAKKQLKAIVEGISKELKKKLEPVKNNVNILIAEEDY
jgi:hypothetical protein